MYSIDLRVSAIRLYKSLRSSRKVSKLLGMHHTTICRWIKCLRPIKKRRRLAHYFSVIDSTIQAALLQNPLLTQPQLFCLVKTSFPYLRISRRTIFESLRRIQFTRKRLKRKLTPSHHPQHDRVQSLKNLFTNGSRMFCIDESGFADRNSRVSGYSLRGTECVLPPLKQYFQSSLVLGIDNTGYFHYSFTNKGVKTENFIEFLSDLQLPHGTCILMDNCSIHKSLKVRSYIESRGWTVYYLPTYCPDSNPVENVFGMIKSRYRKIMYKSREAIIRIIEEVLVDSTIVRSFDHARRVLESGEN